MLHKFRMPATNKEQGFTLVELLVVIAIIAVITAIAVPAFINQRKKVVDTQTISDVKNLATAIQTRLIDLPEAYWFAPLHAPGGIDLQVGVSATERREGEEVFVPMSEGTMLRIEPDHTLPRGGFVIYAYHPDGSRYSSPSTVLRYDSRQGGLLTEPYAHTTGLSWGRSGR